MEVLEVLELECCHLLTPCPSQLTQVTQWWLPRQGLLQWYHQWKGHEPASGPVPLHNCSSSFFPGNFHSSSLLHFTPTPSFLPCLLTRVIWSFHSLGQGNLLKLLPRKFGPHGCKGTEQGIQRWIWTSWVCKCSLKYPSLKCWWLDHKCCIRLRGRLNINLSSSQSPAQWFSLPFTSAYWCSRQISPYLTTKTVTQWSPSCTLLFPTSITRVKIPDSLGAPSGLCSDLNGKLYQLTSLLLISCLSHMTGKLQPSIYKICQNCSVLFWFF